MDATVHFSNVAEIFEKANRLYEETSRQLNRVLPWAEHHHVGSTAVPGSRTKGDLDVVVRVVQERFEEADAILAENFDRNLESDRTDDFSAFEDSSTDPDLGIQLVAKGSPADTFLDWIARLRADPALRREYDQLKAQYEGALMDEYRSAKGAFIRGNLDG